MHSIRARQKRTAGKRMSQGLIRAMPLALTAFYIVIIVNGREKSEEVGNRVKN
jgi:hypothetical protein